MPVLFLANGQIAEASTVSAQDAYTGGQTLADQTVSNSVATFTFSAPVQLLYVYGASSLGTNTYRADPFGGTPSATSGIPSPDGVATAIPVQTSSVKVFGASGAVSVWGFRY